MRGRDNVEGRLISSYVNHCTAKGLGIDDITKSVEPMWAMLFDIEPDMHRLRLLVTNSKNRFNVSVDDVREVLMFSYISAISSQGMYLMMNSDQADFGNLMVKVRNCGNLNRLKNVYDILKQNGTVEEMLSAMSYQKSN